MAYLILWRIQHVADVLGTLPAMSDIESGLCDGSIAVLFAPREAKPGLIESLGANLKRHYGVTRFDAAVVALPPMRRTMRRVVMRPAMSMRRSMWRRPRYVSMRRVAMRPMEPDDKAEKQKRMVLGKFRRVRGQYHRFKKKYGNRLERYWQRILKTAVYSGADRYSRLNVQLNALGAKMSAIRKQAP